MNKSIIGILALMAFALFAFTASAQNETYIIDKVIVNGVEVDGDKAQVEIGQEVEVIVELLSGTALNEARDAKVTVEIDGYEHESIRESTGMFTVSPGNVRYRKTLNLELPTNMEADTYTLYVRVTDRLETVEKRFTLYIEPTRHLVDIVGVSVTPQPYVEAGETATIKVRLENVGAMTEDNVEVVAEIASLGVRDRDWIDLVPSEIVGDDEEKSETVELFLPIPKNAKTGEYELAVGIAYDDGYETLIVTTKLNIKGEEKAEAAEEEEGDEPVSEEQKPAVDPAKALVISFDTTSQSVTLGKETAYKVTVSNLGSEARTVSLSAAGAQLFADIRVDPTFMTIEGGQKADAYVYAKAQADAELKTHSFTLRVLDGEKLYKEVQLSLGVEEAVPEKQSMLDEDMLKIGFIVLVVVLIIVGLLIAFKRVRGSDYPLEPIEERTYY
ncbi:MAG: hypothetical protein KJ955_08300 [Nanoarchaeota archaeon]|nr:hypothetical protein [Nanoarchaeota archaeon]